MPTDPSKPLEREQRNKERKDWESAIKHTAPQAAWKGTVTERGFSYKLDDKFATQWEPACTDFEGLQLQLAAKGAQNVNLCYRIKFAPGYGCPDQSKIVNMMAGRMLGWPCRFKVGEEVQVFNWRDEAGYVNWGIKSE